MTDKPLHTETDAAAMAMTIAICDALIESNLLSVEVLSKKLLVVQAALAEQPTAAGIVGTVIAALNDPNASAARKNLTTLLTEPQKGGRQ